MGNFQDFNIKIAGLKVRMLCNFVHARRLCEDFTVEDVSLPDITVFASENEISEEKKQYDEGRFSDAYCESICLYRNIAERLPALDGFVFHGAAVEISGRGVIFAARSGVGKTTHISLLLEQYPEAVKIINGDKPIIRKIDGEWRVFSTPWAGKEGMRSLSSAPLSAIVLLERADENRIAEVDAAACFDAVMAQVYLPKDGDATLRTFNLIDDMASHVKFYRLGCNISKTAADVSFAAMSL